MAAALGRGATALPAQWGFPDGSDLILAAVEPAGSGQLDPPRLAHLLREQPSLFDGPSAVITREATVHVLTATSGAGSERRVREDLTAATTRVRDLLGRPLLMAVSWPSTLAELPAGREVRLVLRALRRPETRLTTADLSEVSAVVSLLEITELLDARPHLQLPALERMRAHDAQHATAYTETASALLDAFGDAPAAAASWGCTRPPSATASSGSPSCSASISPSRTSACSSN